MTESPCVTEHSQIGDHSIDLSHCCQEDVMDSTGGHPPHHHQRQFGFFGGDLTTLQNLKFSDRQSPCTSFSRFPEDLSPSGRTANKSCPEISGSKGGKSKGLWKLPVQSSDN